MTESEPKSADVEEDDRVDETDDRHILSAAELMEAAGANSGSTMDSTSEGTAKSLLLDNPERAEPARSAGSAGETQLLAQSIARVRKTAASVDDALMRPVLRDLHMAESLRPPEWIQNGAVLDALAKQIPARLFTDVEILRSEVIPDPAAMAGWQEMQNACLEAMQQTQGLEADGARMLAAMGSWKDILATVNTYELLAKEQMAGLQGIGAALGLGGEAVERLTRGFSDFTSAYSGIVRYFEAQPALLQEIVPLPELAAREYFRETVLVRSVSMPYVAASDDDPSSSTAIEEDRHQTSTRLECLLAARVPQLLPVLQGARQASASSNPDKARHTFDSMRVILDAVLAALAPDDVIKSWTNDPRDFLHNGKPIREARARYVCRHVVAPLHRFVGKDLDALTEMMEILNRGTHKVVNDMSDGQIRAFIARVEGTLVMLLELDAA